MRVGATEMIVLVVLVLLVFGPHRLPEIARQVGKALREIRRVSGDFEREVRSGLALDEDYSGNFPSWKGAPRPPMEKAEPFRPPPGPASDAAEGSGAAPVPEATAPGDAEPGAGTESTSGPDAAQAPPDDPPVPPTS